MINDKFRHEYKYLITDAEAALLQSKLNAVVERDTHCDDSGIYKISSLYFDDYYNRCFYENENGTDPREKFRIRIYNGSSDIISLECKRKERGKTLKTSARLNEDYVRKLLNGDDSFLGSLGENKLVERFEREIRERSFHPAAIVEYQRIPYVYRTGNVRITFDSNLTSSTQVEKFLDGGYAKRLVMPFGFQLLEVKFDELLPDFIYKAMGIENLRQTAFSKYYLCRKYHI